MRTIAHLSDLHFGRAEETIVQKLKEAIWKATPDLVVVSGDLTQRARTHEFQLARSFLDSFPCPTLVIPGNHDLPAYNLLAPWTRSLTKYKKYISSDLESFYADEEIAVAGINTARKLVMKGGRINLGEAQRACARFDSAPKSRVRVVVTHHPFSVPDGGSERDIVGRAVSTMALFASCRVDLFLSGHLHIAQCGASTARYAIAGYSALLVQAGTACSTRLRGETNSWNVIRIDGPEIRIQRNEWSANSNRFEVSQMEIFQRGADGWSRPLQP